MPKTTEALKKKFCRGDNAQCARYVVFVALGKNKVPVDLFPGEIEVARCLISQSKA